MNKRILAVGAFLIKDNKVLLSYRQNTSAENDFYSLIGGAIENNESVHEALIREIKEEIGVDVKPENMKFVQVLSFKKTDGTELISFDFFINDWLGEPVNKEPHKHLHIKWFDLDNLPTNIIDRHKKTLENLKKGIYYSSFGY